MHELKDFDCDVMNKTMHELTKSSEPQRGPGSYGGPLCTRAKVHHRASEFIFNYGVSYTAMEDSSPYFGVMEFISVHLNASTCWDLITNIDLDFITKS